MNTISNSIFVTAIIFIQILITGCQVKELSPFEKAKNPYGHLGVEGYMGSAMTTCLGKAKRFVVILQVPSLYLPFQLRFWRGERV